MEVVDCDAGPAGEILRLAFLGFVGLPGTVAEKEQALRRQSQQNILKVINPIGTTDDADLPCYSP